MNKAILGLLATTILVACGNSGGGNGGTTNSDTTGLLSTNSFAQDKLKKKQPSLYTINGKGTVVYRIDPENKRFTLTLPSEVNDEDANLGNGLGTVTVTGKFDPANGRFTPDDCYPDSFYCTHMFPAWYDKPFGAKYIQDGRVILLDKTPPFSQYTPTYEYFGTRPTASDKMPGGTFTYKGHVLADYNNMDEPLGTHHELVGTSTSVVNFDTGIMNVDFTDMKGDLSGLTASLNDIFIDGNKFSEGNFDGSQGTVTLPDGSEFADITITHVRGQFFGGNATDLGGRFYLGGYNVNGNLLADLTGVWSGEQQ